MDAWDFTQSVLSPWNIKSTLASSSWCFPFIFTLSFLFYLQLFTEVNCCVCVGCTNAKVSEHWVLSFPKQEKEWAGANMKKGSFCRRWWCGMWRWRFKTFPSPWQGKNCEVRWSCLRLAIQAERWASLRMRGQVGIILAGLLILVIGK